MSKQRRIMWNGAVRALPLEEHLRSLQSFTDERCP